MKRIAITGPEGSGKSDLAIQLSRHFNTSFAAEYAREYLSNLNRSYAERDLDIIAAGQLRLEVAAQAQSVEVCFFDTDMLVMDVWSRFRFDRSSTFISRAFREVEYDAYLLCFPDLYWENDGLRESPDIAERLLLYNWYREALIAKGKPYTVVNGIGDARWKPATEWVSQFLIDHT